MQYTLTIKSDAFPKRERKIPCDEIIAELAGESDRDTELFPDAFVKLELIQTKDGKQARTEIIMIPADCDVAYLSSNTTSRTVATYMLPERRRRIEREKADKAARLLAEERNGG